MSSLGEISGLLGILSLCLTYTCPGSTRTHAIAYKLRNSIKILKEILSTVSGPMPARL